MPASAIRQRPSMAAGRLRVGSSSGSRASWGEVLPLVPRGRFTELDLRELESAEPMFLIRLAALLDQHESADHPLDIRAPANREVSRYLALMGVNPPGGTRALIPLPAVRSRDRSDVLIPVTRLAREPAVERLNRQLSTIFKSHFTGQLEPLREPLRVALCELCENAVTHGANPHGAFVAGQRYRRNRCVLAIGDLGIGIPKHLRSQRRLFGADTELIIQATDHGVSGVDAEERGLGYSGLFNTIKNSGIPMARLRIWSGEGRATATFQNGRQVRRPRSSGSYPTQGAWINLELMTG